MFEAKFLFTSDDLRMTIPENLNWLYAVRDKSWPNLKLFQYLPWVKETFYIRLCQIWIDLATD